MTYVDLHGNETPPDGIEGEGMVYLGSLRRNRVVFDHAGRRMKVIAQNEGSVTVRRAGAPKTIKGRTFTPPETITLARATIVRPLR